MEGYNFLNNDSNQLEMQIRMAIIRYVEVACAFPALSDHALLVYKFTECEGVCEVCVIVVVLFAASIARLISCIK